jgi:hypothetical protein
VNGHQALSALRLTLVALCLLQLGCATAAVEPSGAGLDDSSMASGTVEAEVHQALFRVRYRGGDGRGRVRLTLRQSSVERFQMTAADSFGRRLWSFDRGQAGSLFLDHRAEAVCRFEGDVVIDAIALKDLPVRLLPRVLLGELPSMPVDTEVAEDAERFLSSSEVGEVEYEDSDRRRWTARFANGLASWTLWDADAPLLWWRREARGGILSHRDGAQALWVMTASEVAREGIRALAVPDGYGAGDCDG